LVLYQYEIMRKDITKQRYCWTIPILWW